MAWAAPKTDWNSPSSPRPSDFNRIEGNIAFLDSPKFGITSGVGNAYIATIDSFRGYRAGERIAIKVDRDSTGAITLNVNNLGAKHVVKKGGIVKFVEGGTYTLIYEGAVFFLQGDWGGGDALASDIRSGKTASTDAGDITGTLDLSDLKEENLRDGITIDGITGTLEPIKYATGNGTYSNGSGDFNTNIHIQGLGFIPNLIIARMSCKSSSQTYDVTAVLNIDDAGVSQKSVTRREGYCTINCSISNVSMETLDEFKLYLQGIATGYSGSGSFGTDSVEYWWRAQAY